MEKKGRNSYVLFYFSFYSVIGGMDINCDVINYKLDKWKTINNYTRFMVLEEINIKIMVSRNMKLCSMIDGWNRLPSSSG